MYGNIANLQELGARVTMMGDLNTDPVYHYINPSIAYDGKGKLRIVIRACSFAVTPNGNYYMRDGSNHSHTKILYGYLDPKTLAITKLIEPKYSDDTPRDIAVTSGLEDARIYWRDDGMHFIGVHTDTRPAFRYPPQQADFVYDDKTNTLNYIGTMLGESPARGEKNWLPPDIHTDQFDYNYSPTEIYKDRKVRGIRYQGFIHGSSQLLWQPKSKTYLAVLHSKHVDEMIVDRVYDKMVYVHYAAEYNEQGILIQLSDPFTYGTQDYIEFCAGMVEVDGTMVMALGAGDSRMGIAQLDKNIFIKLLKPYGGQETDPMPELSRTQKMYIDRERLAMARLRRR